LARSGDFAEELVNSGERLYEREKISGNGQEKIGVFPKEIPECLFGSPIRPMEWIIFWENWATLEEK